MPKRLLSILQYVIFLGGGIFLVWWQLREMTEEDKKEFNDAFTHANYWLIIPIIIIALLSHLSRSMRWKLLMEPLGYKPALKNVFAANFPMAQNVKWRIEKQGEFEVEYTQNSVESSVLYDVDGNLLETETKINANELPSLINEKIIKDYAGYKIVETEKSIDAKGILMYELKVIKGKNKFKLSFNTNGKLLSKEKLKMGIKEDNDEKL